MADTLTKATLTDQVLGCVLGGAVGDALGAPFEGLWSHSIPQGPALLNEFAEFEGYPRGQFTDDTQLTVATLESIVRLGHIDPAAIARSIARLWRSQAVVGPGGACTAAADKLLAGVPWSESGAPVGQAGNGTAMRTAPLGLYFLARPDELPDVVAQVCRITHQDPRSIAGGVAIASAARCLAAQAGLTAEALCSAIAVDTGPFHAEFSDLVRRLPTVMAGTPMAVAEYVAWSGGKEREFEYPIITPYVVPTVLGALWAFCSFPNSWSDAVAAAIGLGGDVDTLGAIVGGLMGARLGCSAIPAHLAAGEHRADHLRALALRYAQVIAAQ